MNVWRVYTICIYEEACIIFLLLYDLTYTHNL